MTYHRNQNNTVADIFSTFGALGSFLAASLLSSLSSLSPLVLAFSFFLVSQAQADQTLSYTYNELGLIETLDGARTDVSDITTFEYDTQGNRIRVTNALGHSTQITTYDLSGRPLTIIDPNGALTELRYDLRGRLISQTVEGNSTLFRYDATGNIKQITQATGETIDYDYDNAHRLIGYHDALGNKVSYVLDAAGNKLSEHITDTHQTLTQRHEFVYDKLSRLINDIGAANQNTHLHYDHNNNRTEHTDAKGNATQFSFDALNRLASTTDADNGLSQYQYDGRDNLISVTDPNGLSTSYRYDELDNLIEQNSPDTGVTTYTHDSAGNRLSKTDAKGTLITYTYDALNRLTSKNYLESTLNVTYQYDENATGQNGIGRLTTLTDASGTTGYAYDKRGNLTTVTTTPLPGTQQLSIHYAYNESNQINQIIYPSGRIIDYSFDLAGRIENVTTTDPQGNTQLLASNIHYQPFGAMNDMTYGNGLNSQHHFDLDAQLTDITLPTVLEREYSYDAVSNIMGTVNYLNTQQNKNYDYDSLNRLIDVQGTNESQFYLYDKTGNRTQHDSNGQTDFYSYPLDSHRLSSVNTTAYHYDAKGNLTDDGYNQYHYADNSRLDEITRNDITLVHYTYNAFGQRSRKTINDITTYYHYNQDGQLMAETDENGQTQKEYFYLQGQLIALSDPNNGNQNNTTTEIILDNNSATFSDNWPVSTSVAGFEGANYQYHAGGSAGTPIMGSPVDNADSGFSTTDTWTTSTSISGYVNNNYQYHAGTTIQPLLIGTPVDNGDNGFNVTDSWPTSTVISGYQGSDYQYHAAGTGNNTASWPLIVTSTGLYDVYVNWTAHPNRATNAKYTVNHANGSDTVILNQQQNGGQWHLIGSYLLNANSNHNISLSDDANGYVIADAVTLLPAGTPPTGTIQQETASWTLNITTAGNYDIYTTWTAHVNRASNATYTIHHANGEESIIVNQQQNGGQWNKLGTFTLDNTSTIDLSSIADGYVIADAVTVLPAGTPPTTAETPGETASWQTNITNIKNYEVYAKWTAHANRASDAKYTLHHALGDEIVTVNQQQNGGQWNLLGRFTLDAQSTLDLSSLANGYVIADSLRLVSTVTTIDPVFYVHNDHLGTPQVISNNNQGIVWQAQYDTFGKANITTEIVSNNIRFPGQYFDIESGLHYNYYRYYDPQTGRYITSDPIGLDGGVNTYSYALQNPLKYNDPKGLNVATGVGVTVGICARYPQACGAAAGIATCAITGMCSKPSWWPDDIPHPSDPPKDTQCRLANLLMHHHRFLNLVVDVKHYSIIY